MNVTSGSAIGVQAALWEVGKPEPCAEKFQPILGKKMRVKPHGGMWTSSYEPQTIGGWAEWCRDEQFATGEHDLWLLTPEPDAEIVEINTYADLDHLHRLYGRSEQIGTSQYIDHWLDFGLIAERYAAVHLTDEGQWTTRLSDPYNLYGWDCESTLWLRWAFVKVEHAGIVTIEARGYSFEEDE